MAPDDRRERLDRLVRLGLSGAQDPPAQPGTDSTPQPGGGEPKPGAPEPTPEPSPGSATTPETQRLIDESRKYRERAQKAEAELAKIASDRQAAEDAERSELQKAQAAKERVEKERDDLRAQLQAERNRTALVNAAVKLGARDPEVVFRLVDADKVEVNDDGLPENAEEVVKAILDAKPYLVGATSGGDPATGAAVSANGKNKLTLETLKRMEAEGTLTPEFERANREAIDAALASSRK